MQELSLPKVIGVRLSSHVLRFHAWRCTWRYVECAIFACRTAKVSPRKPRTANHQCHELQESTILNDVTCSEEDQKAPSGQRSKGVQSRCSELRTHFWRVHIRMRKKLLRCSQITETPSASQDGFRDEEHLPSGPIAKGRARSHRQRPF